MGNALSNAKDQFRLANSELEESERELVKSKRELDEEKKKDGRVATRRRAHEAGPRGDSVHTHREAHGNDLRYEGQHLLLRRRSGAAQLRQRGRLHEGARSRVLGGGRFNVNIFSEAVITTFREIAIGPYI